MKMMKTMKLDRLNQWLSLVANFGVIAGFILVAYQLNLNTESIRLRNAMDLNRDTSAAEIAFMGETTHVAFANAIFRPADMTDEQIGQVTSGTFSPTLDASFTGAKRAATWIDHHSRGSYCLESRRGPRSVFRTKRSTS